MLFFFNRGAIINYRVAIPVCMPVQFLAIHIVYIGYNSFQNVGLTVLANGRIMKLTKLLFLFLDKKLYCLSS